MSHSPISSPDLARLSAAVEKVRARKPLSPRVAITLGSGLGSLADAVEQSVSIPTEELPEWPRSTVPGHAGRLVFGRWRGVAVGMLVGRTHRYEGYPLALATLGVRVLEALGARTFLFTNAAGGLAPGFRPGDLMLASDHINFVGKHGLLIGDELAARRAGRRVASSHDPALRQALTDAALRAGVPLRHGVLLAMHGPSYETAAEIRMGQRLGASAVCMSTVHEVTLAAELGARAASLSTITNLATGLAARPLAHDEVTLAAREASGRLIAILEAFLDVERGG
jgi:purine-nucleoside phosphorylase